jgi:hypothetical protein
MHEPKPILGWYFPDGQDEHGDVGLGANRPAAHATHFVPPRSTGLFDVEFFTTDPGIHISHVEA